MADTKKSAKAPESPPEATETQAAPSPETFDKPIVLQYKPKKGKKKGYSKGFRDLQRTEARLAKISAKAARAVAKGAETYLEARSKSASKKRDGAIRDLLPNLAEGLSESLRQSSSIPVDAVEAMNTKTSRQIMRNQMRMARAGLRLWRL
jgi:hypothetical protein